MKIYSKYCKFCKNEKSKVDKNNLYNKKNIFLKELIFIKRFAKPMALLLFVLALNSSFVYADNVNNNETRIDDSFDIALQEDSIPMSSGGLTLELGNLDVKNFSFIFDGISGDWFAQDSKLQNATSGNKLSEEEMLKNFKKLDKIIKRQENAERMSRLQEAEAVKGNAMLSYNPFFKSGLSVSQFNKILEGTGLEGNGESYYKMENEYGVNGIFAISVAFHESGYGKYRANSNNFYGMRSSKGWMKFESPDANIQYFGELMQRKWYYGKDITGIAKVYCPDTYTSWAAGIKSMMRNCWEKI